MKLYLLFILAFVAVLLSSAAVSRAGQNSDGDYSPGEEFHCADCAPWNPNLTQLHEARWLCMRSSPFMLCPSRSYTFCKKYCEGAARTAPAIYDEDDKI